jgi:hypothetical protein
MFEVFEELPLGASRGVFTERPSFSRAANISF